uniref:Uncharacterized protein n=1 Tax=Oryza brachyantha TaxID=4533 RepID=J3MGD7_ORYBR
MKSPNRKSSLVISLVAPTAPARSTGESFSPPNSNASAASTCEAADPIGCTGTRSWRRAGGFASWM